MVPYPLPMWDVQFIQEKWIGDGLRGKTSNCANLCAVVPFRRRPDLEQIIRNEWAPSVEPWFDQT